MAQNTLIRVYLGYYRNLLKIRSRDAKINCFGRGLTLKGFTWGEEDKFSKHWKVAKEQCWQEEMAAVLQEKMRESEHYGLLDINYESFNGSEETLEEE